MAAYECMGEQRATSKPQLLEISVEDIADSSIAPSLFDVRNVSYCQRRPLFLDAPQLHFSAHL